ncbi:MAG: EscS/YscS/HrcS family type III secretion system export apparatus protein [Deltaproteobacteria bacterium RBG_13_60_28]|jgi:flagellar biosynthetic protein FliQ|nr:MAG: EscS/YscS/HrcS family type III secretion system export apparatus protein [Deltaproteobacteria bacterium RBG_13_60_28]
MSPEQVIGVARQAIQVTLLVSLPILGIGLVVGVLVSLVQAATQIQEMTLTFVPKIIAIFVGLLLLLPWIMNHLVTFTVEIFHNIPNYVR